MPILCQFYGIIIKMYFLKSEHNPPHIHAQYSGETAEFSIVTGELLAGELPPKATALVREWLKMHKKELIETWETQTFREIEPLM